MALFLFLLFAHGVQLMRLIATSHTAKAGMVCPSPAGDEMRTYKPPLVCMISRDLCFDLLRTPPLWENTQHSRANVDVSYLLRIFLR